MGEKPFGIDLEAADAILASTVDNPHVFVRCASQFPFAPAVQRMGAMAATGEFGEILEVGSGFLHSSDLNPDKPINWKRRIETNGEYGVMGDLGMHVCNIVPTRPTPAGTGLRVPCETWDNATLLCETENTATGRRFPWVIKTQRIAPGERNTWYLEIKGTRACARYSTRNSNELQVLHYSGGEQNWQTVQTGHDVTYGSITGGIFEFGFSDAILQMWAAFLDELMTGEPAAPFAGCATPAEAHLSHRLFTAALLSQKNGCVATV
jgi:predicted dehydrogenase